MKEETRNESNRDIRMIALDLDGTTLGADSVLTETTKETLEEALRRGIHVIIATGRCHTAVPEEVLAIKGLRYVVTSNGAKIRDLIEDTYVYSDCMSREALEQSLTVLEQQRSRRFGVEIFVDGVAYMEAAEYEDVVSGSFLHRSTEYVRKTRNPVEDLFAFARRNGDNVENINVFFETAEERAAMKPFLENIPGTTFTSSFSSNWELEGENTSKRQALRFLMDRHSIHKDQLMACGDSPNDITMMELAGLPVAVGNAKPPVLAMAAYVTDTNKEDGVAKAIRRFALNR